MSTVFISELAVLFMLYIISNKRYKEYIRDLNNFKLKYMLPIGLIILDTFKRKYSSYYDRKLLAAAAEVYGLQNGMYRLRIHLASRIVLAFLTVIFCTFIGSLSNIDAGFILFCCILTGCAVYLPDKDLYNKVVKRRQAIRYDFPDFINKLTLLINAGMTVQKAWEKAAVDSGRSTPLYIELKTALLDIKAGKPEHSAYEEFAKRCRTPEITRFISVILQNIRKGNSELVPILRMFSVECWEIRKNTAKRYGEEASTKMLFPMMLMFLAVLIIAGVPAILSLRGII